jgi:cell division protein YceG involved in septum cleavage
MYANLNDTSLLEEMLKRTWARDEIEKERESQRAWEREWITDLKGAMNDPHFSLEDWIWDLEYAMDESDKKCDIIAKMARDSLEKYEHEEEKESTDYDYE